MERSYEDLTKSNDFFETVTFFAYVDDVLNVTFK
jgi:hypothetical protein